MIGGDFIPRRRADVSCHPVDDEALVYDEQRNATHRLNCTAYFIWRACDGARSCAEIAGELTQVWDASPQQAEVDVLAAVRHLARHELIEV